MSRTLRLAQYFKREPGLWHKHRPFRQASFQRDVRGDDYMKNRLQMKTERKVQKQLTAKQISREQTSFVRPL
jgi:hypothetical protein